MLFYSKTSQYALKALAYLVKHPESACLAEDIAQQENIPKPFLSKILQELTREKILNSTRGRGGGYVLARDPKSITFYEVISVFDKMADEMKICAIGNNECSDENPCDVHEQYKELLEHVNKFLESITLSTFAGVTQQKKME